MRPPWRTVVLAVAVGLELTEPPLEFVLLVLDEAPSPLLFSS